VLYFHLLYRHECFTGKYTTCKIHKKLHPGPEWFIFHNLTREFIDDVIILYFAIILSMSFCLYNKKNITRRLLFCHSKIKFISSRHCVISSMYSSTREQSNKRSGTRLQTISLLILRKNRLFCSLSLKTRVLLYVAANHDNENNCYDLNKLRFKYLNCLN